MLQDIFEINIEKRAKNLFVPINGKQLIALIDDMNMPMKVKFNENYHRFNY
jgi:dynein heavy chain